MTARREFLAGAGAFVGAAFAGCVTSRPEKAVAPKGDIRAFLMHLGHNMWCDWPTAEMGSLPEAIGLLDERRRPDLSLRCKDEFWRQTADHAAKCGVNMIVVDLGEGVEYPSHPELAIEGTWSVDKMRAEIERLNAMGVEVIPKLNFSTTHNGWMKDWRHMVSSRPYYRFCEDVIRDVFWIFDSPRFMHIGFDEETTEHQGAGWCGCNHIDVRRDCYWQTDFLHIVKTVEGLGMRPWTWSDYGCLHEDFLRWCPKSVIQSNWFYDESYGGFDPAKNKTPDIRYLKGFWAYEKAGFDQIPCGTNWVGHRRRAIGVGADDVIGGIVKLGREVVAPSRLLGFMMAPWAACDTAENVLFNKRGADLFAAAL